MKRQSVIFASAEEITIREEDLPEPGDYQVVVETIASAISPGTEMLIYRGEAPKELPADSTIGALSGNLAFPLKYGYAVVGKVIERGSEVDREWLGQTVFAFHPHESHFTTSPGELIAVPPGLSPEDALFYPNMETAVTFLMDGAPLIGEQVAVFGQGIVGLLTAALLAQYPLARLITADNYPLRRETSHELGADVSLDPALPDFTEQMRDLLQGARPYPGADLTYELSGSPQALDTALSITGFSGRIVIGSWYGTKHPQLNLGGAFHRSRIRLIASQVSTIDPAFSGRWNHTRRTLTVLKHLRQMQPSQFITHRYALEDAADAYELLHESPGEAIQVILTY